MGIKDMFGKGGKKAEFREQAKKAVRLEAGETPHYFFLYGEGIRLERTVGNAQLESKPDDSAEIVGELLSALMR